MSPLLLVFRAVRRYLLASLFWGVLAALVYPWGQSPFSNVTGLAAPGAAFLLCLGGMTVCLAIALVGAAQAASLLRHRGRPGALLDQLNDDLNSRKRWKRRLALQVLADYHGQPFGVVSCWPGWCYSAAQLRNMTLLYQEWLRIREDAGRGGALSPHILRRLEAPGKVVVRDEFCEEDSGLPNPPPGWKPGCLRPDALVAALRERVDQALRQIAEAINEDPPGRLIAATEERIRDLLADLLWEALKTGIRLKTTARQAGQDRRNEYTPLGRAVEGVMEQAADAVKDALLDAGLDDDSTPDPAQCPLPPLQPAGLAAALREPVERTVAAVAERVNAAPDLEGVAASEEEIRELFDDLAGRALELAAGLRIDAASGRLPLAAGRGGWVKKFRRMVAMESLADPVGREVPEE